MPPLLDVSKDLLQQLERDGRLTRRSPADLSNSIFDLSGTNLVNSTTP
jgi:hypothetical protein